MEENGYVPHPAVPRRRPSCLSRLLSMPVILMIVLFFVLPPFLSLTAKIFVPETVKLSWDLFSVLLVLFAILSGIFANRNDGRLGDATPPVVRPWLDEGNSGRRIDDEFIGVATAAGVSRGLRRSGGSYSDLMLESAREAPDFDDRSRCFDDLEINRHSSPESGRILRRTGTGIGDHADDAKVISVDTCVLRSLSPPPSPPPELPLKSIPPPPAVLQKAERTYESVESPERPVTVSQIDAEFGKISSPAPAPPPLPAAAIQRIDGSDQNQKLGKFERRKSIAKKEIAMVLQLATLYTQRKRIDKKQKAKNVRENASESPPEATHFSTTLPPPSPVPPPPPLPPPPSVFHSLFRKGMIKKSWKKIHSLPPPQPPPPPSAPLSSTIQIRPPPVPAAPPKSSRRRNSSTSGKPPLIPLPPALLTFRTTTKPVVSGDFVRIKTTQSLCCSGPKSEAVDQSSSESGGGDAVGSVFCPSPDVNVKADTFIARLKDGWRLEKMNSVREKKDVGLGPETEPGPMTGP